MPEHVVSKIVSQKYKELAVRVQKAPKYCAMAQMQNIEHVDFMMLKQHA